MSADVPNVRVRVFAHVCIRLASLATLVSIRLVPTFTSHILRCNDTSSRLTFRQFFTDFLCFFCVCVFSSYALHMVHMHSTRTCQEIQELHLHLSRHRGKLGNTWQHWLASDAGEARPMFDHIWSCMSCTKCSAATGNIRYHATQVGQWGLGLPHMYPYVQSLYVSKVCP